MAHGALTGAKSQDFTVPVTSGNYATEVLEIRKQLTTNDPTFSPILDLVLLVETLTATAQAEIDVLRPGGDPSNEADWIKNVLTASTVGLYDATSLRFAGVRIRVKSGGTAGTTKVSASWSF